jgi:hypothetical protein
MVLGKRRCCAPEEARGLLGRDLVPAEDAIGASAQAPIRHGCCASCPGTYLATNGGDP